MLKMTLARAALVSWPALLALVRRVLAAMLSCSASLHPPGNSGSSCPLRASMVLVRRARMAMRSPAATSVVRRWSWRVMVAPAARRREVVPAGRPSTEKEKAALSVPVIWRPASETGRLPMFCRVTVMGAAVW